MRGVAETAPGRLLRLLFFWRCEMPADPDERLLRWMHFYNRERPHAALGKATPNEAYGTGNELKKAA